MQKPVLQTNFRTTVRWKCSRTCIGPYFCLFCRRTSDLIRQTNNIPNSQKTQSVSEMSEHRLNALFTWFLFHHYFHGRHRCTATDRRDEPYWGSIGIRARREVDAWFCPKVLTSRRDQEKRHRDSLSAWRIILPKKNKTKKNTKWKIEKRAFRVHQKRRYAGLEI